MPPPHGWADRLLQQVRAGMVVYDRHRERVGTVTAVGRRGDEAAAARRGQLAQGFVEIETAPPAGRRYAAAGQLAAVDGERVLLNVGRGYLATH